MSELESLLKWAKEQMELSMHRMNESVSQERYHLYHSSRSTVMRELIVKIESMMEVAR